MRKPMRKIGTLSRLAKMPQQNIEELIRWLTVEKITYPIAVKRLQERFGFKSSPSSLSEFYQVYCAPRLIQPPPPSQPGQPAGQPGVPPAGQPTGQQTGQPGVALVEIIVELAQPNVIRLKITPGSGVKLEGQGT